MALFWLLQFLQKNVRHSENVKTHVKTLCSHIYILWVPLASCILLLVLSYTLPISCLFLHYVCHAEQVSSGIIQNTLDGWTTARCCCGGGAVFFAGLACRALACTSTCIVPVRAVASTRAAGCFSPSWLPRRGQGGSRCT
jgi:hypothetical protein